MPERRPKLPMIIVGMKGVSMDQAVLKALEDAGYLIEGDTVVLNVTENVQLRANDLSHLVDMCTPQKLDPVQIVEAMLKQALANPNVQTALNSPGNAKLKINVSLKGVRLKPKAP